MTNFNLRSADNMERIMKVSQGLPGAVRVLTELGERSSSEQDFHNICTKLAAMNITRNKLWAAYSVVCEHDISRLIREVHVANQTFVDAINAFAPHGDYLADVRLPKEA